MVLTHCTDTSPADWLTARDEEWFELVSIGPSGFEAYARLRFIPDPLFEGQSANDAFTSENHPRDEDVVALVCDVLATETTTPDDCYFCLWDGWPLGPEPGKSWIFDYETGRVTPGAPVAPAFGADILDGPLVRVPNRDYLLFHGPISDVNQWGSADDDMQPASFIWPADRAWCFTCDVDPHWACIGGSRRAIDRLVADTRFDCVPNEYGTWPPTYTG